MPFTAAKRALCAISLALVSCATVASEAPPRVLQEPVFGLHVERANPALEVLPEDVRAKCFELADNEDLTGRMWVFARVDDGAAAYYVVGGYFERRHPGHAEARFRLDTYGGVYKVEGITCTGYGAAREVFDVPAFDEISLPIRQGLAADLANRLARLSGDRDRLRLLMRDRKIDFERLSPQLRDAFLP